MLSVLRRGIVASRNASLVTFYTPDFQSDRIMAAPFSAIM
jgi:hypothetical protein